MLLAGIAFFYRLLIGTIDKIHYVSNVDFFSAEKFLEGVEINQNYAILLLHLIDKDAVDMTIRVAAAIAFKNYIKRNWAVVSIFENISRGEKLFG
jgi:hypothetical protein